LKSFTINALKSRFPTIHRDILLFISTISALAFANSIFNSVFNNFLNETFTIDSFNRTFLELPRESGGFLVVFVSASLFFLRSRRMAFAAILCGAVGLIMMALFSVTFHWMFAWLFLFSLGQHLFMPLYTSIAMELAEEGKTGRRLGQLNSIGSSAAIMGSFFIFLGFKYFHFNFKLSFLIAASFYLIAAMLLFSMHPGNAHPAKLHLKFHREYRLYYWLAILFGTRKQVFLTFAPWVLVTVYKQPTAILATLITIGGISGILFQPFLGKAIDSWGERTVLALEAFFLIFVCMGYGLSKSVFLPQTAFYVACVCFVADQLLMSVNMARATYLKKVAVHPSHITPTLTMAITLDHIFSISIALTGGLIWAKWGYQAVFMCGAGIAVINLVSAMLIRLPEKGMKKNKGKETIGQDLQDLQD
jgi:predicted MFS family arabinose efflux permease